MTNHKTIEQWADEYSSAIYKKYKPSKTTSSIPVLSENFIDCYESYLAGAAKQKELLMPIIEEMKEALLRISHSDRMFNYPQHEIIHALLVEVPHEAKETLASIEEKLKEIK